MLVLLPRASAPCIVQVERELLSRARTLLAQVIAATSAGKQLVQPPASQKEEIAVDAKPAKGAKPAKPAKPAKGAPAPEVPPVIAATEDAVNMTCDIEAWHVDVMFRARYLVWIFILFGFGSLYVK
jgi:hypothetical protein